MKTITINLYSIDELPEEVQKEVIDKLRFEIMDSAMEMFNSEYRGTLLKFGKITQTKLEGYSVGYSDNHYKISIDDAVIYEDEEDNMIYLEDIQGKNLFRYVNNNIMPYITKR